MNTSTDSYHNLLITGGPTRDDLPLTTEEALDEFEGNIKAICEEIGQDFNDRFMETVSLHKLILAWKRSGVGDALLISELGWQVKTYTVERVPVIPRISNMNAMLLSDIAEQSTRRGRAPVISIVYNDNN